MQRVGFITIQCKFCISDSFEKNGGKKMHFDFLTIMYRVTKNYG